jgi:hypothetical protein
MTAPQDRARLVREAVLGRLAEWYGIRPEDVSDDRPFAELGLGSRDAVTLSADLSARTGLPLRCLEVGASGGLNLRWDHFRYGGAGRAWGAASSPVDLRGHWEEPPAVTDNQLRAVVEVAERRGCDRRPVDPTVPEGRLALSAAVWADQTDRLERLRGALRVAADVPATVEAASLDEWTAKQLAEPAAGAATVVFHSVVEEYVDDPAHARFRTVLVDTAARATAEAPLAWLRLEPVSALRAHALTLTVWPDGEERLLAGIDQPSNRPALPSSRRA